MRFIGKAADISRRLTIAKSLAIINPAIRLW